MRRTGILAVLVIFFVLLLSFVIGEGIKAVKLRITINRADALIVPKSSLGIKVFGPLEAEEYFSFGEEALKKNQTGMALICFRAACALDSKFSKLVANIYEGYSVIYKERGNLPYTDYFINLAQKFEKGG